MVESKKSWGRPINRPRSWQADQRQKQKHDKKKYWFRRGGHHVPLFVPHTPGSELVKLMKRKEEENNQGRQICFPIVELGGTKLHHIRLETQPLGRAEVQRPGLFPLQGRKGRRLQETRSDVHPKLPHLPGEEQYKQSYCSI